MSCLCKFIPDEVLTRLANDPKIKNFDRAALERTLAVDREMRMVREANSFLSASSSMIAHSIAPLTKKPAIKLFDVQHGSILPGAPVLSPQSSSDQTIKRTAKNTTDLAKFFKQVFGRNSLNGQGMDLISSVHFGNNYNNAFWNGQQMTYGDGDNNIFVDSTRGSDVITHELTHGLTQFTSQFAYSNESGGLNESMSDVSGSMFRQWQAKHVVTTADWLIGADIMGPAARSRGFTGLRDTANPDAAHAMAKQPKHFSDYQPGMGPHTSSGIPNQAFYLAAVAVGGKSWEKVGKVWFQALAGHGPKPQSTMKEFANRTRTAAGQMFPAGGTVKKAVDRAWLAVGP